MGDGDTYSHTWSCLILIGCGGSCRVHWNLHNKQIRLFVRRNKKINHCKKKNLNSIGFYIFTYIIFSQWLTTITIMPLDTSGIQVRIAVNAMWWEHVYIVLFGEIKSFFLINMTNCSNFLDSGCWFPQVYSSFPQIIVQVFIKKIRAANIHTLSDWCLRIRRTPGSTTKTTCEPQLDSLRAEMCSFYFFCIHFFLSHQQNFKETSESLACTISQKPS